MKIITVTGYKGGCGKSVTAVHVATYLSNLGDVVLVDSDPNARLSTGLRTMIRRAAGFQKAALAGMPVSSMTGAKSHQLRHLNRANFGT